MDYQVVSVCVCVCVCVCVKERGREEIANLRQLHIPLQWRHERTHQLDDLTPKRNKIFFLVLKGSAKHKKILLK